MKTNFDCFGRSLLVGAIALTLMQASPARAEIQVDVNDRQVQFGNVGPMRLDGRVFIPLRAVVEALGAEVRWDAGTQTVHGSKGGREFALPIGSRTAQVNGRTLALDAPARLMSGNTMVPLRFVAEALGANVDWNAPEQRVAISLGASGGGGSPAATGETVSGQVISVQANANPRTLTVRVEGVRQTYRLSDNTRITRGEEGTRGARVDLEELRTGDQVSVRLDAAGEMARHIEATTATGNGGSGGSDGPRNDRGVRGEVIRVLAGGNPPLMVVMVNGARKTYEVGDAQISERGVRGGARVTVALKNVLKGDQVTVYTDRTGQIAERIDVMRAR